MTAPRGRPPHARRVESFERQSTVVPDEVVLDTSFVAEVLNERQPLHEPCRDFMVRMASHGTTVYYNRLLELELAEVAFKLAVVERHGKRGWPAKRRDGRVRQRAGRLTDTLMAAWETLLTTVPHLCIEVQEIAAEVPRAMRNWGLASYDATHAATARYVGADGIVTIDAGFGWVPANLLRIYTDEGRVRSCRQRRGGR